jgi:hypothetical protein
LFGQDAGNFAVAATAMGVIVAGWPLRQNGWVEIRNYWPHFPNSVLRLVSIYAGNKDKGQRP